MGCACGLTFGPRSPKSRVHVCVCVCVFERPLCKGAFFILQTKKQFICGYHSLSTSCLWLLGVIPILLNSTYLVWGLGFWVVFCDLVGLVVLVVFLFHCFGCLVLVVVLIVVGVDVVLVLFWFCLC